MRLKQIIVGATIIAGSVFGSPTLSWADVITSFDLSGQFAPGSIVLAGSVTIDTTIGQIQSVSFTEPLLTGSTTTFSQGFSVSAQAISLSVQTPSPTGTPYSLLLYFNTPSLVGYAGSSLGSLTSTTTAGRDVSSYSGPQVSVQLFSGSATPATVPEPGSASSLASGLAILALGITIHSAHRRRRS